MAESPSVYSARSELSPQDNVNGAVEVDVDAMPKHKIKLRQVHGARSSSARCTLTTNKHAQVWTCWPLALT